MYILKKSPRTLGLDEPIRHESHKAPVTRRDFLAQGFRTGPAIVAGGAVLSALMARQSGAAWHSDGAILRGMQASTQVATRANVNGFGIAARSENDTSNNPHNPMYGINRVGADGQLLTLIGSQNSDSGGNSMAPAAMMNPAARPTKVDRASDVTGLVDTGELGTLFSNPDD